MSDKRYIDDTVYKLPQTHLAISVPQLLVVSADTFVTVLLVASVAEASLTSLLINLHFINATFCVFFIV